MGWGSAVKKKLSPVAQAARAVVNAIPVELATVDWSRLVTLDFETYFDQDYTLKKMSTSEYVRDKRFKAQMVGIKIGNKPTKIYTAKQIKAALAKINWATHSLLCHNVQFDGLVLSHHYGVIPHRYYCTLSMARGLHSNEIGAGLEDVSIYYGGSGKIKDTLELTRGVLVWPKDLNELMGRYCAVDVDECRRVFDEMLKVYPAKELELVHLTSRMFCAPVLRVDIPRVQKEYEREVDKRRELMYAAVEDPREFDYQDDKGKWKSVLEKKDGRDELTGVERDMAVIKKVIGSNARYVQILMDAGLPEDAIPMKISDAWIKKAKEERSDDNKWTYAFAKDDLDFVDLPDRLAEIFPEWNSNDEGVVAEMAALSERLRALVDVRLAVKSTTNMTRAGRFLEAGKDGMKLPVGYAYYRAHCLTGDAQVLTREGWVYLTNWGGGEIAQWSQDGSIRFAPATRNAFQVHETLVQAESHYHTCTYTKGHTLPTLTSTGKFKARQAGEALETRFDIPISGVLDGSADISPLEAQLAVMVQADGNVRSDVSRGLSVRFGFKKNRKIERCKALLNEAGISFTERWEGGVCRIRVGAEHYAQLIRWVGVKKQFRSELFDAPAATKEAFISELAHWDGDVEPQPNGFTYSTTSGRNANFVATMAHISGRAAFVSERERTDSWSTSFRVYIRRDQKTRSEPRHYEEIPFMGTVYCPTTETGYFMVRQRGNIVVTGNTGRWGGNNKMNCQNLLRGGELRLSILADKGHAMAVADSGQIEARMNGWLWDQADLLDTFRSNDQYAVEHIGIPEKDWRPMRKDERDVYCVFADSVYGRDIWKADKIERHIGKTCVLGLGYQMGAPKFQMTLAKGANGGPRVNFPLEQCHAIVNTYRRVNWGISNGWKMCSEIIEQMGAGMSGTHKCLNWDSDGDGGGWVRLPNGMYLKYPSLKKAKGEKGWDEWSYQSGDMRKKIYGGLLCENFVQALARIVVAEQMLMIDQKYPVVMTTHDEAVAHPKLRQAQKCYDYMYQCMTTPLWWCQDIPLAADGGWAENYSK